MKATKLSSVVRLKLEPELRDAIQSAADQDFTTMSDFIRRSMRAAVKDHIERERAIQCRFKSSSEIGASASEAA